MIIESVRLENIRSYSNSEIRLPLGSVLLEGDIGCGKSTILLAVDFALFGLRAGELSGAELLRHGKNHGKATLNIRIGGYAAEISRTLERKKDAVVQSAGYLAVDGVKHDLMGMGLRSFVFDLLGYPANLLRKNKSLLYRYTVYTPQEQMKAILLTTPDERMSIIRHVFGIDRYRIFRSNAAILSRSMKRRMERYGALAEGLEDLEKDIADTEAQSKKIVEEKNGILKRVQSLAGESEGKKKNLLELALAKESYAKLCGRIELLKSKRAMIERQLLLLEKDILRAKERQKELFSGNNGDIIKKIAELEREVSKKPEIKSAISALENDLRGIEASLSENGTREKISKEVLERISKISKCPTCLQEVGEAHKKGITDAENKKISKFSEIKKRVEAEKSECAKKLEAAKSALDELGEKERELLGLRAGEKEYSRLASDIASKEETISSAKKEMDSAKIEMESVGKEAEKYSGAGENHAALQKEIDVLDGEISLKRQALARLEQQATDIELNIASLGKEIGTKKEARESLLKVKKLHSWLEGQFSPLMETLERHMLGKIHHEFNAIFREWFGMLIEDEALSARIDATFTPVVEQNGFETEFGHLSGGEKTSVALAYRLTLNRVINSLSDMIKTKDILILDEPTDGFSTEQLDKVRDVLKSLALRQIIIVSHEEKMEGFVDSIIRIEKANGESRVVARG